MDLDKLGYVKMKIIIAGGRDFNNYNILDKVISKIVNIEKDIIISGAARGADSIGADWAKKHSVPVKMYHANWDRYGKSAGYIRNAEMGENADALIAFWDGKSKGTLNMIKTMQLNKKPYRIFDYEGNEIARWP